MAIAIESAAVGKYHEVTESRGGHGLLTFAVLTAATSLAISGCALLKAAEPPRETYDISAPKNFGGLSGGTRAQILVKLPTALKTIDTDRMIVKPEPTVITYLAGAQWGDTVPKLVQARLVEAFENTGRTGATAKPGDGLVIDYQLVSDLRRFEIDSRSSRAVMEISVKLLSDKSGQVLETRIFTATAPAVGDGADVYVRAFDDVFDEAARDIISWVLNRV